MDEPIDAVDSGLEVAARYASFDRLASYAERRVGDWPRADVLRLVLVLEELFINSVGHGYGGECDSPVRLCLVRAGNAVEVLFEDAAPAFDPHRAAADAPLAGDPGGNAARVGGLGLWLVRHYVHDYRHAYEGGRNRIAFTMRPAAAQSP